MAPWEFWILAISTGPVEDPVFYPHETLNPWEPQVEQKLPSESTDWIYSHRLREPQLECNDHDFHQFSYQKRKIIETWSRLVDNAWFSALSVAVASSWEVIYFLTHQNISFLCPGSLWGKCMPLPTRPTHAQSEPSDQHRTFSSAGTMWLETF